MFGLSIVPVGRKLLEYINIVVTVANKKIRDNWKRKKIEAKNEEDSKKASLTLRRMMRRKFNWISDKILSL